MPLILSPISMITVKPQRPKYPCLLVALCCLLALPCVHAAGPTPSPSASDASPAAKSGSPDPATQLLQTWLHNTGEMANKLFAATEDLKKRTDNRRVFPGGAPETKAPFLRQQVEDLDKQRAGLEADIAKLEDYKTHHAAAWGVEAENLFLEVQISERSIGEGLAELRDRLKEQHRWFLLGH